MSFDVSVKSHIRALEEQLLQPDVRKSVDAVADLLDDRFREFRSSGHVADKRETIAALCHQPGVLRTISGFEAIQLSAKVVLATYKAARHDPGVELPEWSLRSSLWVSVGGRWRLVFHQGTTIEGTHSMARDCDRP
jgi:hypothetical protein